MQGAGIQNIMGGVTSGSKMGLDYMKYMELLNSMGSADVGKTGSALSEIPGGSGKSNGLLKMLQSFLGGGDPSNSSGSNISLPTP